MNNIVKAFENSEEYSDEKCFISEIFNRTSNPELSIAKARVLPGVTTELHWLKDTEEKYFILSGNGEMEVDGKIVEMVQGNDLVIIPANTTQRIKNIGKDDLIFLCICTPKFDIRNYMTQTSHS